MLEACLGARDRYEGLKALLPPGTFIHAGVQSTFADRVVAQTVNYCETSGKRYRDEHALMCMFKAYSDAAICLLR